MQSGARISPTSASRPTSLTRPLVPFMKLVTTPTAEPAISPTRVSPTTSPRGIPCSAFVWSHSRSASSLTDSDEYRLHVEDDSLFNGDFLNLLQETTRFVESYRAYEEAKANVVNYTADNAYKLLLQGTRRLLIALDLPMTALHAFEVDPQPTHLLPELLQFLRECIACNFIPRFFANSHYFECSLLPRLQAPPPPSPRRAPDDVPMLTSPRRQTSRATITADWKRDLREIYLRTIARFPIAQDLPRLIHKIKLYDNGESIAARVSPDAKNRIAQTLYLLTILLDAPEIRGRMCLAITDFVANCSRDKTEKSIDQITEQMEANERVESFEDIASSLKDFLENPDLNFGESRVAKVLKLCNQKVIFPPFAMFRQSNLFLQFPFKDFAGKDGWQILIHKTKKGEATVTHVRKQQSSSVIDCYPADSNSHEHAAYVFTWRMKLCLSKSFSKLKKIRVQIEELCLHPELPQQQADEIRTAFSAFKYFRPRAP